MKTLRYFLRLTSAFIVRFKGLILIGIVFGIILYFLGYMFSPLFSKGGSQIIGISGRYYAEEMPEEITNLLSTGLTRISNNGTPVPAIAESWDTPDEGITWIFNLSNTNWHDGDSIISADINYNFTDVEIDRPNDTTIVFKLENPFSPFPAVVSRPVFKQGLLGVGEWKVDNLVVSQGYVQEVELINDQQEKVVYKFYTNESQTKTAFKLGHINKMVDLFDPTPFDAWNTVNIHEDIRADQVVTIFLNNQSDKFKENKPLRQALSYGINKSALSQNRAISPINPHSWAYNPQVKSYDYDLERAKELINDVPQEEKDKPIDLTTTPLLLETAEKVKNDWEKMGLSVEIHVKSVPEGTEDALLTVFDIPDDPDQYQIWHSTQESNNTSKFGAERIDALLEEGRAEIDLETRKRIYFDFQRFLLEEAPAIFLYHPSYYDVVRK